MGDGPGAPSSVIGNAGVAFSVDGASDVAKVGLSPEVDVNWHNGSSDYFGYKGLYLRGTLFDTNPSKSGSVSAGFGFGRGKATVGGDGLGMGGFVGLDRELGPLYGQEGKNRVEAGGLFHFELMNLGGTLSVSTSADPTNPADPWITRVALMFRTDLIWSPFRD